MIDYFEDTYVKHLKSTRTERSPMSFLFRVMSLVFLLGTTQAVFRSGNPEGYPDEVYDIVTEDGYVLGLYRIPYGKINKDNSTQRLVVYLQHGLFTSASSWISNLPNNSVGFILADAGYDIWMGNSRGTTWSRKHTYLNTNSKEFWAFRGFQFPFFCCNFDEMAKYDLLASINFIVRHTGQEGIFYVGHSQGTSIAFITFSTIPKIAGRIKVFFALAPVFSIKNSNSPLIKMAYSWRSLIKTFFGSKDFLPNTSFKRFVGSKLCPLKIMSRVDVYMSQNPAGTSIQNMVHWSQLFNSSHLRAFDWGSPALNLVHFNQATPPFYNVTDMNVSTATWNGGNDLVADPEDVENLLSEITHHIYHKTISYYNHIDFLFRLDVYQQVYHEIVDIIRGSL
ncbi:unnamed protein product [Nyctereutes procyonoides]|uniref:Lipase n=1 Tax=Nyctereutes procyonoides TaxID=34880 RepID=A0A811YAK9_NYCPR|nr:unnamed protein product [Nyctereutes procyonoides]